MLGELMKALNPKKETPPPGAQLAPAEAFQVGKQVTFKDPKTGEHVYQIAMTAENRSAIMQAMQKNANIAQRFLQTSRQALIFQDQSAQANKEITESEKEINTTLDKIRDELKLDKRWGLNMQLGLLERRDPPSG